MQHSILLRHSLRTGAALALFAACVSPLSAQATHNSVLASYSTLAAPRSAEPWMQLPSETLFANKRTPRRTSTPVRREVSSLPKKIEQESEERREEALEWLEGYKFREAIRASRNGRVDWDAVQRAIQQRDNMAPAPGGRLGNKAGNPKSGGLSTLASGIIVDPDPIEDRRWRFMGPRNLATTSNLYFGPGNVSGRINAAAFDPVRLRTFYVGAPMGGVWRTDDSGQTWTPLTDFQAGLSVSSIVIDPNSSNTLYIGTGDYDGYDGPGIGILKSIDRGQNWTRLGAGTFGSRPIRSILIDPTNSQVIYATAGGFNLFSNSGALFKSTDGGQNWVQILNRGNQVSRVLFNSDRSALFCSVDGAGISRSTDGGATWQNILNYPGGGFRGRLDIASSPADPGTLYYLTEDGLVGKTANSTAPSPTWADIGGNFPSDETNQTFYDFYLNCNRIDGRDILYAGMLDVTYGTATEDGQTWNWIKLGEVFEVSARMHTDQHTLAINPNNPRDMLVGNDGGVYRMVHNPGESFVSFQSLNAGLGVTQFYALSVHPRSGRYAIGGTQDDSTPRTGGSTNNWIVTGFGDGGYAPINPVNPRQQYFSTQGLGLMGRTDNNWGTFFDMTPDPAMLVNPLFIHPVTIDSKAPNYLYTGVLNCIRYDPTQTDAGQWTERDNDLQPAAFTDGGTPAFGNYPALDPIGSRLTAIGVSPIDSDIVMIGNGRGEIFYSNNAGDEFTRLDVVPFRDTGNMDAPSYLPNFPGGYITSIQGSKVKKDNAYVTIGGTDPNTPHVWRSSNITTVLKAKNPFQHPTFTSLQGDLPDIPVNCLAVVPSTLEDTIFVGTDIGVFLTTNGGRNWTNATAPLGLPNVKVTQLIMNSSTGVLTASTYGRGIWTLLVGNNNQVRIQPALQYYRGNKAALEMTLQIGVFETKSKNLTGAGYYIDKVTSRGTFEAFVTVPRFLRKRIPLLAIPTSDIVRTSTMFAGDVNGDNLINATDLLLVQQRIGQFWSGSEDVDGDGQVTARDLNIIKLNLGRRGD